MTDRKPTRNFGILQLGGGYGMAKRVALNRSKYETKTEKHRRGPLNGLIPGGAFGRAARGNECTRSDCRSATYGNLIKLLKAEDAHPYLSFESGENGNARSSDARDGQEIDVYTPYQ